MFARFLLALALLTLVVSVIARTSSGHGPARAYTVRPGDTLWSIAASAYGGDPREGVWRIERRNRLASPDLEPGQRLVLP